MGGGGSKRDPKIVAEDHFERGRQVGEGGFGKVFAIEHYKTKKWYAMKHLAKKVVRDTKSISMITNERDLLAEIPDNPFIINMSYAFQDDLTCILVLDLAMGGDLRYHMDIADNKALGEEKARFYSLCCVLGLEFLHGEGIAHRDIKPANIVVASNGYCQITDFGISKKLGKDGWVTGTSGTRAYMAPEVLRQSTGSRHNCSADVFSLGLLMYEMLAGTPDAGCSGSVGGTEPSEGGGIKEHSQVKGKFLDLCQRTLLRSPEARPSMTEISQHEWFTEKYSSIDAFKKCEPKAPWVPNPQLSYFVTASTEMMSGFDCGSVKAPERFVIGSDPDFPDYEYNVHVEE